MPIQSEDEISELTNLLSAALDEIYMLRRALAYEARVVEAHTLDLKSLSKSRRLMLGEAVARMRNGVLNVGRTYAGVRRSGLDAEAKRCGFEYLTRSSWAQEVAARREPA